MTGFIPFGLALRPLTDEERAADRPYDGPREVPDGCVVIDSDYDTGMWYLSDHGGWIVPSDAWDRYRTLLDQVAEAAETFQRATWIAGWAQRGEPEPEPPEQTLALIPTFSPWRNRIPRTPTR